MALAGQLRTDSGVSARGLASACEGSRASLQIARTLPWPSLGAGREAPPPRLVRARPAGDRLRLHLPRIIVPTRNVRTPGIRPGGARTRETHHLRVGPN